jgi:glucokinase
VGAPRLGQREEWIIGVDVGGTKIAAGAVEPGSGTVAFRREMATRPERGAAAVLADVETLAETVAGELRRDGRVPVAVGIGVPELVDAAGHIRSGHLLDWSAIPLAERLGAIAPAVIAADVRAAALAEARHGAGREFDSFAYISIGSGISSTVVQDGVPLVGARGGALVLSSGSLGVPCPECSTWTEFVLEDYASGPALARRYAAASSRVVEGAETVLAAANAGEPSALQIVDSAADALGSSLGWLVNVLDPEASVSGGGLGLARGRFRERLIEATRGHIWNPGARGLPFVSAALGADAGLIGAVLTAERAAGQRDFAPGSPVAVVNGERR